MERMRMLLCVLLLSGVQAASALGQTAPVIPQQTATQAAVARERVQLATCKRHLEAIGRAMQAYRRDHREFPEQLSDLYPRYLKDKSALHCPADPTPGDPGLPVLPHDSRIPTSYLYGMSRERVPETITGLQLLDGRAGMGLTWRDVRTTQALRFGGLVPLVTCIHHAKATHLGWPDDALHLTMAGTVRRCSSWWETEPATVEAIAKRIMADLNAGPKAFERRWLVSALDAYLTHLQDFAAEQAPWWRLTPPAAGRAFHAAAAALKKKATGFPAKTRGILLHVAGRLTALTGDPPEGLDARLLDVIRSLRNQAATEPDETALKTFLMAARLAEQRNSQTALRWVGDYISRRGRRLIGSAPATAQAYGEAALKIQQQVAQGTAEIQGTYDWLGDLLHEQARHGNPAAWDSALEMHKRLLAICEKKDPGGLAEAGALAAVGDALVNMGKQAQALPYFERVLKIIEPLHTDPPGRAWTFSMAATAAHAAGDRDKARRYWERVIALAGSGRGDVRLADRLGDRFIRPCTAV
jgi:tetratricopeptide (TPR) repeat protein